MGRVSCCADANGNAEIKAECVKAVKICLWKSLELMEPLCETRIIEIERQYAEKNRRILCRVFNQPPK